MSPRQRDGRGARDSRAAGPGGRRGDDRQGKGVWPAGGSFISWENVANF